MRRQTVGPFHSSKFSPLVFIPLCTPFAKSPFGAARCRPADKFLGHGSSPIALGNVIANIFTWN